MHVGKFEAGDARDVSKQGWSSIMSSPSLVTQRVTLVVAFGFLLQDFGKWWEHMNAPLWYYGRRLSSGNTDIWCRRSNLAFKLNFGLGRCNNISSDPFYLFPHEPPSETFTNYFSLSHIPFVFNTSKGLLDRPVITPTKSVFHPKLILLNQLSSM